MKGYFKQRKVDPRPLAGNEQLADLVDNAFVAYNSARLREACQTFVQKMLEDDVTVGVTLSGALTPAGLGISALIPMMEAGFIDWIISTGANLYHDTHFALGLDVARGSHMVNDVKLHKQDIVRIYDVYLRYDTLLSTDAFFREIIMAPEFQRTMSSAEFHHLCGKYIRERELILGTKKVSLLAAAYELEIPVYTPSPGDSSIGMNIAAKALEGNKLNFDVNLDVNETASIVWNAKRQGGKSAIFILGGGAPKNFALQTEPHLQEVMGLEEVGHDFFIQVTDARPDTGGLSGATPSEAVSWGKINPDNLPDTVVCYLDSTVALPILASYALARHEKRSLKRLYAKREQLVNDLTQAYLK